MARVTIILEDVGNGQASVQYFGDPPIPIVSEENFSEVIPTFTPAQKLLLNIMEVIAQIYGSSNIEFDKPNAPGETN